MTEPFDIIETVRLTEKGTLLGEPQIKWAIEKLLGKPVVDVNTCNYSGKKKRERRADYGRTAHWKKAIVTLKEGDSIDLA